MTVARFSFPRQARLLCEREFRAVYRGGRRLKEFPLRCRALKRQEGGSRLGLAIGRKVGGAVVRNRWKRAIREAFRLNRHRLRSPYDLVISVDWQAAPEDVSRVPETLVTFLEALNKRDGQEAGS